MTDWISVKDRRPEDGKHVLVFSRPFRPSLDIGVVTYTDLGDGDGSWWDDNCNNLDVSHWMPLPDPPKEQS